MELAKRILKAEAIIEGLKYDNYDFPRTQYQQQRAIECVERGNTAYEKFDKLYKELKQIENPTDKIIAESFEKLATYFGEIDWATDQMATYDNTDEFVETCNYVRRILSPTETIREKINDKLTKMAYELTRPNQLSNIIISDLAEEITLYAQSLKSYKSKTMTSNFMTYEDQKKLEESIKQDTERIKEFKTFFTAGRHTPGGSVRGRMYNELRTRTLKEWKQISHNDSWNLDFDIFCSQAKFAIKAIEHRTQTRTHLIEELERIIGIYTDKNIENKPES